MYVGPRISSSIRPSLVLISMLLASCMVQAQLTMAVGSTSTTQTATITITATGTSGVTTPIYVLTQGAQNSDFKLVSGGSCAANTNYSTLGATCTVNYTFTPSQPGPRNGGITLVTSTGVLLGNTFLTGTGTGPQVMYSPPRQSEQGTFWPESRIAVDGRGDQYVIDISSFGGNPAVEEIPSGCISGSCFRVLSTAYQNPTDLAVDGSGNLYIGEAVNQNNALHELIAVGGVIPDRPVTVDLSPGGNPVAIAVDGNGNIYAASNSGIVKLVAVNGVVTPSTGAMLLHSDGGVTSLAVDASGNVYYDTDYRTSITRIAASDGSITTFGTDRSATGMAFDGIGNLYVANADYSYIEKYVAVNGVLPANPALVPATGGIGGLDDVTVDGRGNLYIAIYSAYETVIVDYADAPTPTFPTPTNDGSTDTADGPQSFQIFNGGNATLTAVSPGLGGLTTGWFSQVAGSGTPADCTSTFSLVVGDTCNVSIQFAPAIPAGQSVSDTFTLIDNDMSGGSGGTQTVNLNATAVPPQPSVTSLSVATGPSAGGTPVTITGVNLTGTSAVMFGSVPATGVSVASSTQVAATSPAGTGGSTVDVTVISYGATSVTSAADHFAYALTPDVITVPGTVPSSIVWGSGTASIGATSTSGQPVTYTSTTSSVCSVVTSGVVTFSTIGTCTVNVSQAAAGSYAAAATVPVTIQVTPAANTITFPALSDTVYGNTPPIPAAASTSGQPVTYASSTISVCTSTADGNITLVAIGTCNITANQSAAGNYAAATQVQQSFTVIPVTDTITIPGTVPTSVFLGSGTISIGATSTSGQPLTYASTTLGVCSVTTPDGIVTALSAGLCTVNVSQAAAGNYTAAATVPVSINMVAVANTITFPILPNTAYYATPPVPAATATSGQPVTYSSSTMPICTVTTDGTITFAGTGICTITASQNAVGNYAAALSVSQSFLITAGTLPVGTSSGTVSVPVTITTAGTLNAINVLTQGATGLDFNIYTPAVAPSGACATGTPYIAGQICTVQYTFKPTQPFVRAGGVSLSDASGNLLGNSFVSGTGTGPHVIYSSVVQRALGSGFANAAAVAVDASGDVFVADSAATTVKEIVAVNGVVPASPTIRTLGSGFLNPGGIAVDGSGNVYVADSTNSAIKELVAVNGVVPSSPTILTLGGNVGPTGVAVDASGNVFVADTTGNAVKEIPPGCMSASCVITLGAAQSPQGIAVDGEGNVYVADFSSAHVKKFVAVNGVVPPGSTSVALGSGFDFLYGLAVDGLGNVYLADTNSNAIKEVLASNGSVVTLATGLNLPQGIAVDVNGNVYDADTNASSIKELSYTTAPSLNFATATLNSTPDTTDGLKSFQIINNGNATLTAVAPGIGGLSTGSFALAAGSGTPVDCASTFSLAVGASCNVSIGFTPAPGSNGAVTDTVTLIDNSLNANPSATQTVSLSGTAIVPGPVITGISPSTGSVLGGTVVTITGSGFTGAFSVAFGSRSATSYTVVSDTTITAVYQGGTTGAVDVTVITIAGVSATSSADLFTSTIPAGLSAGTEPVGMQSAKQTAYIKITKPGTLNTISVLTQGATGRDFNAATGGAVRPDACTTTTAYTAGQVCTVQYTFTPTHPWQRAGGVSLADASGNILGSTYLSGTGTGPQATYTSNTMTPVALGGSNFGLVQNLAVDGSGNVYVADPNNRLVDEIPVGCVTSTCVLTLSSGAYVEGVAVDGLGNVYLADLTNSVVKELVAVGGVVPANPAVLTLRSSVGAYGITVDGSGDVFFTDVSRATVNELPAGGGFTVLASGFSQPYGVAVDQSGNIYVGNYGNGVVDKIPAGGGTPVPLHTFTNVTSLAIDGAGNVYVVNVNVPGVSELIAVNGSLPANPATVQLAPTVSGPYGVAVDASGNVYTTTYTAPVVELPYGSAPAVNFVTGTPAGSADTTDGAQSFQIVDSGNATLTGTAPATGSLTSGNFTQIVGSGTPVDCAAGFSVAAGASCNVSLSFAPLSTASGAVTDTYIVTSNTLNGSNVSQTVTIGGTVVANKPAIQFISPTSGLQSGGAQVGILGSLFTSATAVTFGGVPAAAFLVYNDSIIIAISPPGTGTVDIQVTSPLGTSDITAGDKYTYVVASAYSAGSIQVGTQSQVLTASVNITTAGTLQTISVLTQGATGLDFRLYTPAVAPSGACAIGTAYTAGQSCTVQYTLTPTRPWTRAGGIALADAAGVLLGNSTLSGTGTGPQAVFNKAIQLALGGGFASPNSVALDGAGNVYVADTAHNAVKKIPPGCSAAGCTSTLGSGFTVPKGVAVDGSGNIFVADGSNSGGGSIKEMVAVAGVVPANPVIITLSDINIAPSSVAVDQAGNLYATYASIGFVTEITSTGGVIVPGTTPVGLSTTFSSPQGVAVDSSGNVYVADAGSANAVYELVATGGVVQLGTTPVALRSGFNHPSGVAVDGSGNVYVTDSGAASAVYKILAVNGVIPASPTTVTLGSGFSAPGGVAVDAAGSVYVANTGSSTVQELPYAVAPAISFTTATLAGSTDATDGSQSIQLTNNGNAALSAVAPGFGGLTTSNFAQATGGGIPADCSSSFSLSAGGSCNVSIAFAPTSAANGVVTDTFTLIDNSLNAAPSATQAVYLAGTVIPLPPAVTDISPAIGSTLGGTVITITGTHFTGATAIHFGSTAAPNFTVVSDTSITMTAPPESAGVVDVVVTTTGGTNTTSVADQFTYSTSVPSASIWIVNADGTLARLDEGGNAITYVESFSGSTATAGGIAFDSSGHSWTGNSAVNYVMYLNATGTSGPDITGGGLNAPVAIAIDGDGAAWIANGNGSVSVFKSGAAVTPATGYTGGSMSTPTGISIDIAGNVWVSNGGNNSVTEILGGAAPSLPLAVGTQDSKLGVRP